MTEKIPHSVKHAVRHKFAWPGGYPLFIVCNDGTALCVDCAKDNWTEIAHDTVKGWQTGWNVAGAMVNYEDCSLLCDNCSRQIESVYSEGE